MAGFIATPSLLPSGEGRILPNEEKHDCGNDSGGSNGDFRILQYPQDDQAQNRGKQGYHLPSDAFHAGIINRDPGAAPLIIKPRTPRNHVPKFQAKLGVAEEEPDGPRVRLTDGPLKHTPIATGIPLADGFPVWDISETRKAP